MKKILLYIIIGIPLFIITIWAIFMGYIYFKVFSTLPRNTDITKAYTPKDKYNVYLQTGNNSFTEATGSGNDLNIKISLLEKSVDSYLDALNLFGNEYAAKNLEYAQEQLRLSKLQQQQEERKEEKENGEAQQGEESKKKNGENSEEKSAGEESENSDQKNNSQSKNNGEQESTEKVGSQEEDGGKSGDEGSESTEGESGKDSEEQGLSEETKKILERKAQELLDQQGEIGQFYNKTYKENNSKSQFDNFLDIFGRPQFDNSLLDQNQEKDW